MCPGSCHTQHPHPEVNAAVVIFVKNPEDLVDEHLRPLTMIHRCHHDYNHHLIMITTMIMITIPTLSSLDNFPRRFQRAR